MAVLYANQIIKDAGKVGGFTIDRVPEYWRQQTIDILASKGYDEYGNKL